MPESAWEAVPLRNEFYFNRYVRGTILRPLAATLAESGGLLFWAPISIGILVLVAFWLIAPNFSRLRTVAVAASVCLIALLWIMGFIACWARFLAIARSRAHVAAGLPLLSEEGPARFSNGHPGTRHMGGYFPRSLEINGRSYDLVACSARHELCAVNGLPYVRSVNDPRGSIFGFKTETPVRVWYTPAGVIVRADVEVPEAYRDPAQRGEFLKEKWEAKSGSELSENARKRIGDRLADAEQIAQEARAKLSPEELLEMEKRIEKLRAKFHHGGSSE